MASAETAVIVVGAGPSGLATAACLSENSIPYILIEREECVASLWKKKAYERLHLHLPKAFCQLPLLPFPRHYPTYVSKSDFLRYIDHYAAHFSISPLYNSTVALATFDARIHKWRVNLQRRQDGGVVEEEELLARFLVVATGETADPYLPRVDGLRDFRGKVVHSTDFKSGKEYEGKKVLVVGAGNSGMEIALDLSNHDANTSIVVRSPVHVLSRGMVRTAFKLLGYVGLDWVDQLMVIMSRLVYGDLSKYGIQRPKEGPFSMKVKYGKYPVIDVGTIHKIQTGHIQVLPAIERISGGNQVSFENGESHAFDAVVFATGFSTSTAKWLQGGEHLLNEDGFPKPSFPNHWKGKQGLYCVGLGRRGLHGAASDAQKIADDIKSIL